MGYQVAFAPAGARDVRKLPPSVQARVMKTVAKLAETPRPRGSRKINGSEDVYRIRVGDYRVLYTISDDVLIVLVVRVRHRREVYRTPAA